MLDIGWSELLVIAVVAIVVVGPKDLPPMMRALGRSLSKMRKMAGEFQGQFNEALKEAELDDVKKSFDELRGLNPMNDIKNSLNPLSGPVAKPAPAPVPPSADQPAQLMTASDVVPTPAPAAAEPVVAAEAKPPRAKKKPATAQAGDAPATKPRASRAKTVNGEATASTGDAPVRRARKPKPAADTAVASTPAAVEPSVASVTEEPKT
ncbi:Sec-independent protein translocase protein TatB [Kaistia granuli]|uniref:Sec-independent protein translocase protein TatB n=1 Tax=Kaistia granuli TaxID=363259 RepID=UPI00036B5161|nr:Sec-independent protein translocase protein TatB [Kaistia granuli]